MRATGGVPMDGVEDIADVVWYYEPPDKARIKPCSERAKIYFRDRRLGMIADVRLSLQQFRNLFPDAALVQTEKPQ